ncbi:MAG: hypothetical protein KKB03_02655 [Nanoarchaeota archaeon]|nr:hypothetical protein [Nanoarchaeota archaeon]MBU2520118.1 hypothetical protein [Nanoarchaeota archaeon]
MSNKPHLTQNQINKIKESFLEYKDNTKLTACEIAKEMGLNNSTVSKWFQKLFGEEYSRISIKKFGWNRILTDNQIKYAFQKYKNGTPMVDIANVLGVKSDSLKVRMRKLIGDEYKKIAKKYKIEHSRIKRQKVPDKKIKEMFEVYKNRAISLTNIANNVGIAESSLIARFKFLFGDQYKIIARKRRDERKVTKKQYREAFEKYKNTEISLTTLSNNLGVQISTLAPTFRKMFGEKYLEIAQKKQDSVEICKKGKIAEKIAFEYLKLIDKDPIDIRGKAFIKGTLRRPDFLIDNTFVEVKTYVISLTGNGRLKGYKEIVRDYLNKETKTGKIINKGIIISTSNFTKEVEEQAKKDNILLINKKDMSNVFTKNNRNDLVELLNDI